MTNNKFRKYFPIFKSNPELVYFDSSATTLKPQIMIDSLLNFYTNNGMNIRSLNKKTVQNLKDIQKTRKKIANFINARTEKEIIFTKGTTESLNMIAQILYDLIQEGDEIVTSVLEHHSCLLPWMKLAQVKKAKLVFIDLDQNYKINISNFYKSLSSKTKIIVLSHISNTFGYETPIKKITEIAHKRNIILILDAAQSVGHIPIDVQELDIDFMAFSAHKMYGPFGIGILFGKKKLLQKYSSPHVGGGNVQEVTSENFIFSDLPNKFEPGTLNISGIIAFGKSLELINKIGIRNIQKHNQSLIIKIQKKLQSMTKIKILNPFSYNTILFNFEKIHAHDIETFLQKNNIYVRTGRYCAHLIMDKIKKTNAVRISIGIYNNEMDIEILIHTLQKIKDVYSIL
ncbi:MAG: cysteine desulfurase [Candidatus Phytoplasma stylosanthis]|uniref:aminotransferase class V-fold PLP-dependent enzyme n=1 Tax=Candidatus Phytoplasma stylosanthis TaxID=2798314 RepID=UPI002939A4E0|nr:cysteine desulfurase [Candidatus Phytoplasma stylosanthis]MDV3167777.1 cysteine desulfurase [Candidatus Phytoplasma stylosanthis]MDV3170946.1 cysteine desulfurase [Candidatus Phytoplasma stylosanthis]MDV3173541.1 cysteine desulfurase [Candidatus Phytoplasma stylosanthis]MDV3174118.1 cysteine desulfurase [Candidatus Phytoplasma stylosanthis]MDV3202362.1 cysteine desulfurase [Candidatus Phytoplasma stylosanthis]